MPPSPSLAARCGGFIDGSPTPSHLCSEASSALLAAGFTRLSEELPWRGDLRPGGGYFYTREGSTLVAFWVGTGFVAGNGFTVVGAHTDSPVLKLKPASKKSAHGYLQLNVEERGPPSLPLS